MSMPTDITGLLDLQTLREAVIPLEPEHFELALNLSRAATSEAHQWRTYIKGVAVYGFLEWLEERTTGFAVPPPEDAILPSQTVNHLALDAVCHLVVNGFTLCLIVTESVAQEQVIVPGMMLESPEFVAHLYVLLEVQEEQAQLVLRGCLRYDQLRRSLQEPPYTRQSDLTYPLPLDWFDPDSNHVLFYLQFLDPATLPLPARSQSSVPTPFPAVAAPLTQLNQSMINVWNWSQNFVDATAQTLFWSMPQSLTPTFALRRSPTKVEAALQDLQQRQDVEIPQQAQYAYTTLVGTPFQLAAVTWLLPTAQPVQEWVLLLILVAQPGQVLPLGTQLQVSMTTVLTEVTLETTDLYLYVWVEGNQAESFTPTIRSPHTVPINLPTFICQPNSAL